MKRGWMVTLMALGISTSGICADTAKPAGNAVSAQMNNGSPAKHATKTDRYVQSMTTELGLSKTQQAAVRTVLEESRVKSRALRTEMNDKQKAIKTEAAAKIAALLKPDQKEKFEQLRDVQSEERRMSKDAAGR